MFLRRDLGMYIVIPVEKNTELRSNGENGYIFAKDCILVFVCIQCNDAYALYLGLRFCAFERKQLQEVTFSWGRSYDHNYLRFLSTFGEKKVFFSKTSVTYDQLFSKACSSLSKNCIFFAKFLSKNIFRIITLVPG
jgi:hypothetical protein